MQKGKKLAVIVAVLGVVALVLASRKIYFIRDDGGGSLLWNADEAYLFMDVSRRGASVSYLDYPWVLLKEYLYGVRLPDDQRTSVTVVRVTASGVEHHVVEMLDENPANTPDLYTPAQGYIYANYHGSLYKWTGTKFETATEEEQRRLDGTNRLVAKDIEKDAEGWSKRGFVEAPVDYQFVIDVDSKFRLQVTNKVLDRAGHGGISIFLVRAGQDPEEIWRFNGHPQRVSKVDYDRAFGRR
jgi:hypothetical protein